MHGSRYRDGSPKESINSNNNKIKSRFSYPIGSVPLAPVSD